MTGRTFILEALDLQGFVVVGAVVVLVVPCVDGKECPAAMNRGMGSDSGPPPILEFSDLGLRHIFTPIFEGTLGPPPPSLEKEPPVPVASFPPTPAPLAPVDLDA